MHKWFCQCSCKPGAQRAAATVARGELAASEDLAVVQAEASKVAVAQMEEVEVEMVVKGVGARNP